MSTPTPTDPTAGALTAEERARLSEIAELDLLSRETDDRLQELVQAAAAKMDLPIGLVSIVLDQAQHFAASHGLSGWLAETKGTPVEWAFCKFAVDARTPFVVTDAHADARVSDNPLVTQDGVRCYLGIPLISSRGHALGTLCTLGTEARTFTDAEVAALTALADQAIAHIEARAGRQTD